ncbi:hypothetical protein PAPYR_3030 [Paratrimastix pyriformis]|uniref:RRM domain-containing protein n=1 Tax=Paratrimastix pyriformis TaxID=342808 RepID=A0ABQ8UNL8_9EUKA|nr:hypothetical protein PAPYR_3030 [Paratrimastix pyriformis]
MAGRPPPPFEETEDKTRLFLSVPKTMTEQQLADLFAPWGKYESVRIILEHSTGQSKGIAFVQYNTTNDAANAKQRLEEKIQKENLPYRVSYAQPKRPPRPTNPAGSSDPYAAGPRGGDPYAPRDPYGRDPYGRDPYAAPDPYTPDPYARPPTDPYARGPYGQPDPYAQDPYRRPDAPPPPPGRMPPPGQMPLPGSYPPPMPGGAADPQGYYGQLLAAALSALGHPSPLPPGGYPPPPYPPPYDDREPRDRVRGRDWDWGRRPDEDRTDRREVPGWGLTPRKRLFYSCSRDMPEEDVRAVFGKYPGLVSVELKRDHADGRSRGFGFVEYELLETATRVRAEMEQPGAPVRCTFAEPRPGEDGFEESARARRPRVRSPERRSDDRFSQDELAATMYGSTRGIDPNLPEGSRLFISIQGRVPVSLLQRVFAPYGEIQYITLQTGKNFGYVKFASAESARAAQRALNETPLPEAGYNLRVTPAERQIPGAGRMSNNPFLLPTSNLTKEQQRIRNRRFRKLQELAASGFFSDHEMRLRAPTLYHQFVGAYHEEKRQPMFSRDKPLSERLLETYDLAEAETTRLREAGSLTQPLRESEPTNTTPRSPPAPQAPSMGGIGLPSREDLAGRVPADSPTAVMRHADEDEDAGDEETGDEEAEAEEDEEDEEDEDAEDAEGPVLTEEDLRRMERLSRQEAEEAAFSEHESDEDEFVGETHRRQRPPAHERHPPPPALLAESDLEARRAQRRQTQAHHTSQPPTMIVTSSVTRASAPAGVPLGQLFGNPEEEGDDAAMHIDTAASSVSRAPIVLPTASRASRIAIHLGGSTVAKQPQEAHPATRGAATLALPTSVAPPVPRAPPGSGLSAVFEGDPSQPSQRPHFGCLAPPVPTEFHRRDLAQAPVTGPIPPRPAPPPRAPSPPRDIVPPAQPFAPPTALASALLQASAAYRAVRYSATTAEVTLSADLAVGGANFPPPPPARPSFLSTAAAPASPSLATPQQPAPPQKTAGGGGVGEEEGTEERDRVPELTPEQDQALRASFLRAMRMRFLQGEDMGWVDYAQIDSDERLDDIKQEQADAEDQFFDAEEEHTATPSPAPAPQEDNFHPPPTRPKARLPPPPSFAPAELPSAEALAIGEETARILEEAPAPGSEVGGSAAAMEPDC